MSAALALQCGAVVQRLSPGAAVQLQLQSEFRLQLVAVVGLLGSRQHSASTSNVSETQANCYLTMYAGAKATAALLISAC